MPKLPSLLLSAGKAAGAFSAVFMPEREIVKRVTACRAEQAPFYALIELVKNQ